MARSHIELSIRLFKTELRSYKYSTLRSGLRSRIRLAEPLRQILSGCLFVEKTLHNHIKDTLNQNLVSCLTVSNHAVSITRVPGNIISLSVSTDKT